MDYKELEEIAENGEISLNKFFATTAISVRKQKEFKEDNVLPTYVQVMFSAYVANQREMRDENFEANKEAFFTRASQQGFKIKSGFVVVGAFSDGKDLEASEFESQFVKFSF
jgi:hypothetical protein